VALQDGAGAGAGAGGDEDNRQRRKTSLRINSMSQLILDTNADTRLDGLEHFLESWLGPRRPEYGEPPETLAKLELPDPLRRFYAFAGRWPPVHPPFSPNHFCGQDRMLPLMTEPPGSVHRSGDYLVFISENQGVWVAATLPSGFDPAVWISEDFWELRSDATWKLVSKSLSEFLVTFILQECIFSSEHVACAKNALSIFEHAGCHIKPIWLDKDYVWPRLQRSYYLIDDHILLSRGPIAGLATNGQWYAFNDPACIELLNRCKLPIKL
jgi:hypothetical protein